MKPSSPPLAVSFLIGLAALVGCDSSKIDSPGPAGERNSSAGGEASTLVGKIEIDGSSTVQPIADAIREAFIARHPGVDLNVLGNGTGNGFKKFHDKETDISNASRPIKPGELSKCAANGVAFMELPVAYDGLTLVVHPENDWVKELTVDQLKQMFVGDNAAKRWNEINPDWPDQDINIFAPGTGSGTYDYFHEVLAEQDDRELRSDMTLNEDDNVLVHGVAGNKYSLGFFGVAYYEENKDKLRAVPIVNPDDEVAYLPTTDNIASNLYAPLSRPLFIYVNVESFNRAEVQTFVEFFLNHASEYAEEVGYVRLPVEIVETAKTNMESMKTGTHFVTEDGASRSGPLMEVFRSGNVVDIDEIE